MARWRRSRKPPGGAPLTDKRARYIRLMSQGESNSAACRAVVINRRTGTRWCPALSAPTGAMVTTAPWTARSWSSATNSAGCA